MKNATHENSMVRMLFRCITLVIFLLTVNLTASADDTDSWEELLWTCIGGDADALDNGEWEDIYERMQTLHSNPIDLNHAAREDLEVLPFLSDDDVTALLEYVYRSGGLKSAGELSMLKSMDAAKCRLLSQFVTFADDAPRGYPRLKDILKYGKSELVATANIPTYERKGDQNGYLGYKYRHSLRYAFQYGEYLKAGLVGAQDAGEPFFTGGNGMGYDFYSFYLKVGRMGVLKQAVAGRYRLRFGLGLILNNNLSFGKTFILSSLGRSRPTVSPHSSRSDYNYMQGAAATVGLGRRLELTAFVSYRDIDATLNKDDGSIATILHTGYHRTPTEMGKKNNSSQFASGANLTFGAHGFTVGVSGLYTSLSRTLSPNTQQVYRRYYPAGNRFYNLSIDYGYRAARFSFRGETATGDSKALATINTVSFRPLSKLTLSAVQRFYSYRFYSLFANSFNSGGRVQNESGVYVSAVWQPLRNLQITAYTDVAYYAMPKYQASQASYSYDNMLLADYTIGKWNVGMRYRLKSAQKDNADKTALINKTEQRLRLYLAHNEAVWQCRLQLEGSACSYKEKSKGWMMNLSGGCSALRWLTIYANIGYFKTDDYNSRIYSYEKGMLYDMSFPAYYGNGVRWAAVLQSKALRNITLTAKVATTDYFDRSQIGSGLQQINRSSATDITAQLRWRF